MSVCSWLKLCGGGSVVDLVRTLLSKDEKLPEQILAHILHETMQVSEVLCFIIFFFSLLLKIVIMAVC